MRAEHFRPAQVPFANGGSGITVVGKDFGDGDFLGRQSRALGREKHIGNTGANGIPSRQDGRSRRAAERRGGVEIGKPHSLGGHLVDVRGAVLRRTVDAEVAVAKVVGKDDDEIRLRGGGYGKRRGEQERRDLHRRYSIWPARIARGLR